MVSFREVLTSLGRTFKDDCIGPNFDRIKARERHGGGAGLTAVMEVFDWRRRTWGVARYGVHWRGERKKKAKKKAREKKKKKEGNTRYPIRWNSFPVDGFEIDGWPVVKWNGVAGGGGGGGGGGATIDRLISYRSLRWRRLRRCEAVRKTQSNPVKPGQTR